MNEYDVELKIIFDELTENELRFIPHIDSFIESYQLGPQHNDYHLLNYRKGYILENNNEYKKAVLLYKDILGYENIVEKPLLINVLLGVMRCAKQLHEEDEADKYRNRIIELHR